MKKERKFSLRTGLLYVILVCWLVPIVIVMALAGVLFDRSYSQSIQQEIHFSAEKAMEQVTTQLEEAIFASKSVSYDGVIRGAYQEYCTSQDREELYLQTNDYLKIFSRSSLYKSVIIHYWEDSVAVSAYHLISGTIGIDLIHKFQRSLPAIMEEMLEIDTGIRFISLDGELYMVRNLLNQDFTPFASVIMMLDTDLFFRPLSAIVRMDDIQVCLDGAAFRLQDDRFVSAEAAEEADFYQALDVDGHVLTLTGQTESFSLWKDNPWLLRAAFFVGILVLPLMIFVIGQYYRNITSPMETLVQANSMVESGNRGYQIAETAPNGEFDLLFQHFNTMSLELKNQFQRAYQEQRATQRAEIKALQSQINPHFLNNTLEIINWEARLADNDRVSAMIEALSTMMGAVLDREGKNQIPLKEELSYIDAYLFLINERLGGRLQVHREIDPQTQTVLIPRLILQPIVENAVEHDITPNSGGCLTLRATQNQNSVCLEVYHGGTMTQADRENIRSICSDAPLENNRVGLRNVYKRMQLLYADEGSLVIDEVEPGLILARLVIPKRIVQP